MADLVKLAHRLNRLRDEHAYVLAALARVTLLTPLGEVRRLKDQAEELARTIARLERRLK